MRDAYHSEGSKPKVPSEPFYQSPVGYESEDENEDSDSRLSPGYTQDERPKILRHVDLILCSTCIAGPNGLDVKLQKEKFPEPLEKKHHWNHLQNMGTWGMVSSITPNECFV